MTPSMRAAAMMEEVNPQYIARNHRLDAALTATEAGDLAPFMALLAAVSQPYAAQGGWEQFAAVAPAGTPHHVTFCGT